MVPEEVIEFFSDDEELSIELPNKEIISIRSNSPDTKSEPINAKPDDNSVENSPGSASAENNNHEVINKMVPSECQHGDNDNNENYEHDNDDSVADYSTDECHDDYSEHDTGSADMDKKENTKHHRSDTHSDNKSEDEYSSNYENDDYTDEETTNSEYNENTQKKDSINEKDYCSTTVGKCQETKKETQENTDEEDSKYDDASYNTNTSESDEEHDTDHKTSDEESDENMSNTSSKIKKTHTSRPDKDNISVTSHSSKSENISQTNNSTASQLTVRAADSVSSLDTTKKTKQVPSAVSSKMNSEKPNEDKTDNSIQENNSYKKPDIQDTPKCDSKVNSNNDKANESENVDISRTSNKNKISADDISQDYDDDFHSDTNSNGQSSSVSHSSHDDTVSEFDKSSGNEDDTDEDCPSLSSTIEPKIQSTDLEDKKNKCTGDHPIASNNTKYKTNELTVESLHHETHKDAQQVTIKKNNDGNSKQSFNVSVYANSPDEELAMTQNEQLKVLRNGDSRDVNRLSVGNEGIRPVSSRSERITRTVNNKTANVDKKILRKRSDSLPNKILKDKRPFSSYNKKSSLPKNVSIKNDIDIKYEKTVKLLKTPLPSLNNNTGNISRNKRLSGNDNETGSTLNQNASLCTHNETRIQDVVAKKSKETVPVKPTEHPGYDLSGSKSNVPDMVSDGKMSSPVKDMKQLTYIPKDNNKRININDFTKELVEIHKQSSKEIDITVEEFDDNEINDTRYRSSLEIRPQQPSSSIENKLPTESARLRNTYTRRSTGTQVKSFELMAKIKSNSAHINNKCNSSISKKFETEPKEAASNQYSISPTAVLTNRGNDTSKSVTDKTNSNEYLITGNELISPLASSEGRKHEENNFLAIKLNGDDIKESDAEYFSAVSEESEGNMDADADSKSLQQKALKKRPMHKNLYRSHTRPKHLSTNKLEDRNLKYGLDRPASPFIFNGSKAYVRQNSEINTLGINNEDTLSGDIYDKRRSKTGLADLARLKDIRRQLRLADEVTLDSASGNTESKQTSESSGIQNKQIELKTSPVPTLSASPEIFQTVAAILNEVIANVCTSAKEPSNSLKRRCTATNSKGKDISCCILQAPNFVFNLSVVRCEIIDVSDITPVIKTRHEMLLSQIISVASPDTGEMGNEGGLVVFLPIAETFIQTWQEPVVRELDDTGNWTDVEGECCVAHVQDGKKTISGVEVKLKNEAKLAVIARPKLDVYKIGSPDVTITSSIDSRIEVSMGKKSSETERCLTLQTIPVDVQILNWFSRIHSDDEDYQILSCSPLVDVHVSSQHAESLKFSLPYTSLYTRASKKAGLPFSTSCVHSPMPRIPSPYLRRNASEATPRPTKSSCGGLSSLHQDTLKSGKQLSPKSPARSQVAQIQPTKGRSNANIPSGEKHLVQLREGPGKTWKLLSLSKVTDVTADSLTFGIYENSSRCTTIVKKEEELPLHLEYMYLKIPQSTVARLTLAYFDISSVMVIETRTGLQYTSIGEVTRAFTDFISLRKVTVKVYQTLCEVQTLNVIFEDSQTNMTSSGEDAAYFNYIETEILLNEGDLIAFSFKGNIQQKKKSQTQFCYHTFSGFRTTCVVDVQNPYGQRSLPAFHGILQIFCQTDTRVGPIDVMNSPDLDTGWECITEVPVTLPKAIAKINSNVVKAPLALELEEPLTPDFMRLLCRDLRNDWERFAKELHIGRARIQSIKQQNKTTIPEKIIMDILASWMKRQPKVNDKASPLVSALKRCNKWQLASELRERQKTMTSLRSETAEDLRLQRAITLVSKSTSVSRKWRQLFYRLSQNCPADVTEEANVIEANYIKDSTCCHHALYRWKNRTGKATVWELVDALRTIRCNIVADAILAQFTKSK